MQVDKLLAEGKSQAEIGRILGFTRQAVSRSLKARAQPGFVETAQFEGLGPLENVIRTTLGEIKHLSKEIKAATSAKEREPLNRQRLAYLAEARKDFELALKIDEKRFQIDEVMKFRDFVIQTIGECDEETRTKIVRGLNRRNALQRSLKSN